MVDAAVLFDMLSGKTFEFSCQRAATQRVVADLLDVKACNTSTITLWISNGSEYEDWGMMNFPRTNLLISILVLFCARSAFDSPALAQERTEWLSGSELTKASESLAVSVNWQLAPLRQRLGNLSNRQRIAIFLDRRVDGSQTLDFSVNNVSFEECLWRLCDQLELGMCRIGDVYYVGPREAAANLPQQVAFLKDKVDRAERQTRRRWERKESLTIPQLAQPRSLVLSTCQNIGATLEAGDTIPHDLWAETQLPPLEVVDRLSLLLVGFEKSIELNDRLDQIRMVEMPVRDKVTRVFHLGENVTKGAELVEAEMPEVQLEKGRRGLTVNASGDESLRVHRLLVSMQKPEVADLSRQVFTLTTINNRGTVLNTIAAQLGRDFKYEKHHLAILNGRIELNLKDAPVDQVIGAVLEGTGLQYRITDEQLMILGGSSDEPKDEKKR